PADQLDRIVPRGDAGDRTDRFLLDDAQEATCVVGNRATEDASGFRSVVVHRGDELLHLTARLVQRLALLAGDRARHVVDPLRALVGQLVQILGAFGRAGLAPGAERLDSRLHRGIDVVGRGSGCHRGQFTGGRVGAVDDAAGAVVPGSGVEVTAGDRGVGHSSVLLVPFDWSRN